MVDVERAYAAAASSIAEAALGAPAGPMRKVASRSHHVFLSAAVVVKIVDVDNHTRLDRELALAVGLPAGLAAPVLSSGVYRMDAGQVRYGCVARLPGAAPGMGLHGVDRATACRWAEQAVRQLQRLHDWAPADPIADILRERLDHGGFVGRSQLLGQIDRVRDLNREAIVPRPVLDGLAAIAELAPHQAATIVPIHADCHWDNWLVHDNNVTALLDFEWARFGEPADDWMFLSRFSGPHQLAVLGVIADETATSLDALRAACELREAAHLTWELRFALESSNGQAVTDYVGELHELVIGRSWWQPEP